MFRTNHSAVVTFIAKFFTSLRARNSLVATLSLFTCAFFLIIASYSAEAQTEYRFEKRGDTPTENTFKTDRDDDINKKAEAIKEQAEKAEEKNTETSVKENSGWSAAISDELVQTGLSEDQKQLVIRINNYLNSLTDLKGRFLQVNPDDEKQKGKFYLKRPGRIRFDYAPPSLQKVIANGEYLSIEDRDIDTYDRYPLEKTPFRILLAKEVNIVRDAIIKGVIESDQQASIIMVDRKGEALGQIELTFDKTPDLQLKQWKVTDVQGRTTQVILSNLQKDVEIDGKLFKLGTSTIPFFNP